MKFLEEYEKIRTFFKGVVSEPTDRKFDLSVLGEIAKAISYTSEHQLLLKLIMSELSKIIEYDLCAALFFESDTVNIIFKPLNLQALNYKHVIRKSLVESASLLTGEDIQEKEIKEILIPFDENNCGTVQKGCEELRSFFNVPFSMYGRIVGMINLASCKNNAFSEGDVKGIYTIINQTSNAIGRLQKAVTAEKTRMESMVKSIPEGVIMLDQKDEVVVFNPQARMMLGFGLNISVTSKVLNEKLRLFGLDKMFKESHREMRSIVREINIVQKNKSVVFRSSISPVKDIEGKIIGIVAILRDITREKEMDRMKTEFISIVSHELRTPLTTMKEFTAIIADEIPGKLTEGQREYVNIIQGNIDRLARLIGNLLNISKIESGTTELKKELVDVVKIVESVVLTLRPGINEKKINLRIVPYSPQIAIYADSDSVFQIFTNLINNAIKFTPDSGEIIVKMVDKHKEVEFIVKDTGIGIASESIDKVFDRFQQFGRTTGSGEKGTGLGLAITKELIKEHQGKIWVKSELEEGTKFYFLLPKYDPKSLLKSLLKECICSGEDKASGQLTKVSLVKMSLVDPERLRQELSGGLLDSALRGMEDVLRDSLRSSEEGDTVINVSMGSVVVLADCDKQGMLKVKKRLNSALDSYLVRRKLSDKIEFYFDCLTYPDDVQSAEDMISKVDIS